jgi:predicted lipid-binding transport protein (Tim44 family)
MWGKKKQTRWRGKLLGGAAGAAIGAWIGSFIGIALLGTAIAGTFPLGIIGLVGGVWMGSWLTKS